MKHFVFERTFRYEVEAKSMKAAIKAFQKEVPIPHTFTTNVVCEDNGDEEQF